jgi:porin
MNKKYFSSLLSTSASLMLVTNSVFAANFGGPDAVENTIEADASDKPAAVEERLSQDWFDWKTKVQEDHGLSLGIDYTNAFLSSSENGASGDSNASSGMVRFFGSWDLLGRGTKDTGALIWKVEHRHKYSDVTPQAFGFDQGYVGLIEPPFSDEGARWTNLFWRQRLNGGKATVTAGLLDATDYLNLYSLTSPWTGFMNFAFSTGSQTMFIPNDATTGIAGATMLTDNIYVIAGLVNAYTDPTKPFKTFDDFFTENEYFTSLELGWAPSQGLIFFESAHVTFWHVDASIPAGTPGGWGLAFNYTKSLNNNTFKPFLRGGYADDGGTLLQKSIGAGFGLNTFEGRDELGVGVNWGQPNENSFGQGLKDQYVIETYYRYQLAKQLAITPDIQLMIDPPNNPNHDKLWILGLRARLAF